MGFIWVLIPLAGIGLAAFSEWLKFKKQTAKIGNSTVELESAVSSMTAEIEELREERQRLVQRVQNLETIVTSEAWETLGHDRELAKAKAPPLKLPDMDDAPDEVDQVAHMAKRLRG